MLAKRWSIAPPAPDGLLRQYRGINPILAQVLYNRGFTTPEDAFTFLYSKGEMGNPFHLKGVNKAVGRIRQAIKRKEKIVVYGDFDADGVTSTTLLMQTLRALGADARPYIPHRIDEGYGLNSPALIKLAKGGAKVVITVDCGIRSVQEVVDGNTAGLDIIVTDHHSIGPEIPPAFAVINPKQEDCKYPEDMLAGVGVAFRLADALLRADNQNGRGSRAPLHSEDLLDLAAIGTVADLMPLNRLENRMIVRRGLEVLNRADRPGVRALLEVAGIKPGTASTTSIGFGLGPRINAAGRLGSAMSAYQLLSATNPIDAEKWALKLQQLNTQRQELTRNAQEMVNEQLAEVGDEDVPLIFAGDSRFQPGIVGLVAGRLTEQYYRPTIILEQGAEESRASCRSIPQFDVTQALDRCADLLVRHGGHALAAGFTILNNNIPALKERMMHYASEALAGQDLVPSIDIDMAVDIHQLSEELVDALSLLEPTGYHNAQPLFVSRNVRVLDYRTVGDEGRHLKLKFARAGQPPLDAIAFRLGDWAAEMPDVIDVAYYVELNEWNGRTSLQMNVQDIHMPGDRQ